MSDTALWTDLRTPYQVSDLGSITLAATQKMLWAPGVTNPMGNFPVNYWGIGKTVKLEALLKWTSGTAGNIAVGMAYGAADAAAVNVVSATHAAVASVGPFLVYAVGYATCVTLPPPGTAGTLSLSGMVFFPIDLMLSTVGMNMGFPNAGVTVVSTFDNSVSTNGLFFQALRSAGTDSVVPVKVMMSALN
jgi:hypothetical protein